MIRYYIVLYRTSKVKRENNKSWYWQRNMRQLLIFCLLLTSFPLHVICFTGYSLSEAFSNQVIQNVITDCSFWITSSVQENYKFSTCCEHRTSNCFLICSSYGFTNILTLWIYKIESCYLHSQYIRINKQTDFHKKIVDS